MSYEDFEITVRQDESIMMTCKTCTLRLWYPVCVDLSELINAADVHIATAGAQAEPHITSAGA